jgi:F-type H+-transporting ATPase subunit delta
MAEKTTIARPYAKAAFEVAQDESSLSQWSEMLALISGVITDPQMPVVLDNPKLDSQAVADFVLGICGDKLSVSGKNFVRVLSEAGRLSLAPNIYDLFQARRHEEENVVNVEVISAYEMDEQEKSRISEAMSKRLNKKINITVSVDESLIGGSVIRAGDSVIDASIKGQLKQLGNQLAE